MASTSSGLSRRLLHLSVSSTPACSSATASTVTNASRLTARTFATEVKTSYSAPNADDADLPSSRTDVQSNKPVSARINSKVPYGTWISDSRIEGGARYRRPYGEIDGEDVTAEGGRNWLTNKDVEPKYPFPMNPSFRPPPPLSDRVKTMIWEQFVESRNADPTDGAQMPILNQISQKFGLSVPRVQAIIRLKGLEFLWAKEGKTLREDFSTKMERYLAVPNAAPPTVTLPKPKLNFRTAAELETAARRQLQDSSSTSAPSSLLDRLSVVTPEQRQAEEAKRQADIKSMVAQIEKARQREIAAEKEWDQAKKDEEDRWIIENMKEGRRELDAEFLKGGSTARGSSLGMSREKEELGREVDGGAAWGDEVDATTLPAANRYVRTYWELLQEGQVPVLPSLVEPKPMSATEAIAGSLKPSTAPPDRVFQAYGRPAIGFIDVKDKFLHTLQGGTKSREEAAARRKEKRIEKAVEKRELVKAKRQERYAKVLKEVKEKREKERLKLGALAATKPLPKIAA